jgi:hypothetical protein
MNRDPVMASPVAAYKLEKIASFDPPCAPKTALKMAL